MNPRPLLKVFALSAVMLLLAGANSAAQARYNAIPIAPPPGSGGITIGASGINDFGHVVGRYTVLLPEGSQVIRSFFYSDETGSIPTFPEVNSSEAKGINNLGQIALHGGASHLTYEAFRHTPGIGYEPLGNLGGMSTEVTAINASGQVTGNSQDSTGTWFAFRYSDGTGMENLGALFGQGSSGVDINDQGWVVGASAGHAFLFRDGEGMIDLGVGAAYGINNNGYVVGRLSLDGVTLDAFVYRDGMMQVLSGSQFGSDILGDINGQNVAVGTGLANGNQRHALIWNETDGLVDLNTFLPENSGWTLVTASGINELGQISGQGVFNGQPLAYRLDPVPEPATWVLLSLGSAIVWCGCRRKRRLPR